MINGLIVNPLSGGKNRKGLELVKRLSGHSRVMVRVLENFADLGRFVDEFAAAGVRTVFVSSGDGTIQEIQTQIAERKVFAGAPPALCLLPHGTTNLTAIELGLRISSVARQAEFIAGGHRPGQGTGVITRPTMRIVNPADGRTRHGMFVSAGAVCTATQYCQGQIHKLGFAGWSATLATFAVAAFNHLVKSPKSGAGDRIDRPYRITVRADGETRSEGNLLMFLASTLNKLLLGATPFWGGKTEAIRATTFSYPPPNLLRWAPRMAYGREDRKLPGGCLSYCARRLDITTGHPFVLDGEFFDPPADEPLRIEKGMEFDYICSP